MHGRGGAVEEGRWRGNVAEQETEGGKGAKKTKGNRQAGQHTERSGEGAVRPGAEPSKGKRCGGTAHTTGVRGGAMKMG